MIKFRDLIETCSKAQKAVSQEKGYLNIITERVDFLDKLTKRNIDEQDKLVLIDSLIKQ